jgi:hypothetical protein
MAVGWAQDKLAIDSQAGQLVYDVRESLRKVSEFKAWLDQQDDASLTAKGYQAGDITTLRAGIFDMDKLKQIAHAQAQQVGNNNFFFNADKLTGVQ